MLASRVFLKLVQVSHSSQSIAPVQAHAPAPITWMRSGYSPTEIILAASVLVTAVGSVIISTAALLNALSRIMQGKYYSNVAEKLEKSSKL